MPKLALQISAQLTNVQQLRPATDDASLMMRVKCSSCHEEHKKEVSFSPLDEVDVQGGKGKANFVMSCQFCKRPASANFETPTAKAPLYQPYDGPDFATLCVLEFRGMEPVGFVFEHTTWRAVSEAGATFAELEFEDGEWTDYDEKGGCEVSIMEVESRWVRA